MPVRYYICDKCEHKLEKYQQIHDKLLKKCPKCKKLSLYQDLVGIHTSVKQYKTLGSIAERNTKELGIYGREDKENKIQEEKKSFNKRKEQILEERGLKTYKSRKNKHNINIPDLPKEVKKKINDKKAMKKYIEKGVL